MAPTTDETTEVVPTPDADARKFNNVTKTYERMTYEQLKKVLLPVITDTIIRARNRAQLSGFSLITERFDIQSFRSTEVNDVVHIVKEALALEFGESHEIFTIFYDTNERVASSDFRRSNAQRDLTFMASPL
jgi:signal recognition particle GTPase